MEPESSCARSCIQGRALYSERYTQSLPADLTYELALMLPWRDLYESYMALPEYQRYDPDHRLWRQLYHRDLSTYPLPPDANYRDQYFWGRALVDSLDLSPKEIEDSLVTLIELGYDIPFRALHQPIDDYHNLFYAAAKGGYLGIVEFLGGMYPGVGWSLYLTDAIDSQSLDMVNYILDRVPPTDGHVVTYRLPNAAKHGGVAVFDQLFDYAHDLDDSLTYCQYLRDALESRNIELAGKMLDRCSPFDQDTITELLTHVKHVAMLELLFDRGIIPGLEELNPVHILRVGVYDCRVDYMNYAHSRGAAVVTSHVMTVASCPQPNIHQWVVENTHQDIYGSAIVEVIDRHPELAHIYLDALTESISEHNSDNIVSHAMMSGSVPLLRDILNNPHIRISSVDLQLYARRRGLITQSPDMMNYLLSLLPRQTELNILKSVPDRELMRIMSHREYTTKELVRILVQRQSGDAQGLAEAVPPAQRESVAKDLGSYYRRRVNKSPQWQSSTHADYVQSLMDNLSQ